MHRLYLTVTFICVFISIYAQNGYRSGTIQTKDNEVIKGRILYSKGLNLNITCSFIQDGNKNPVSFSPEQIASYSFDGGSEFHSKRIIVGSDSIFVFAERILNGKIKLFTALNRFFVQKEKTFLELLSGDMNGAESENYLKTLSIFVSDCKEAKDYIEAKYIAKNDWIGVVKKALKIYNNCNDTQYTAKKIKIQLTPLVGINNSQLSFANSNNPSLLFYSKRRAQNKELLYYGLDIDFLRDKNPNRSLVFGIWYIKNEFSYASNSGNEFNEFAWANTSLQFTVGPRFMLYQFRGCSINAEARIGASTNLSMSASRLSEVDNSGVIYSNEVLLSESAGSLLYGGGFSMLVPVKKLRLNASVNYYSSSSSISVEGLSESLSRSIGGFMLAIGLRF